MSTDDSDSKKTVESPERGNSPESPYKEEPLLSAARAATNVNNAINETIGKYLAAAGIEIDLKKIQDRVCARPFFYMATTAGFGFVVGGGMTSKLGLLLLGLGGRRVAAETAANFGRQMLQQAAGTPASPRGATKS
jgi:hypothetical protein